MLSSLLMCPPDYFSVRYSINPWMQGERTVDSERAQIQWQSLYRTLQRHARVHLMDPHPKVPDLVFTANAGLIHQNRLILSRFRHPQRQMEEPLFKNWFESNGYTVIELEESVRFEGAGDGLFQPGRDILWAGYGFRTGLEAHQVLKDTLTPNVVSLKLTDPRFYHLDTCFCPLQNDQVMYYPGAFDNASVRRIEEKILPENRILVSEEDAVQFSCNAVVVGSTLIMNHAGEPLKNRLELEGYSVCIQPVTEFIKAGGANKCLTMSLPEHPVTDSKASESPRLSTK